MDILIAQGKELGLSGTELLKFISEQQAIEREERATARDNTTREKEAESQRLAAETESNRIALEGEKARCGFLS